MLWDRMGFGVVGWDERTGGTRQTLHKPISIIINHKFTRPTSICTLGEFSLSQNGQPLLAQPNFHTLKKVTSAHRSIHFFGCVSYDRLHL